MPLPIPEGKPPKEWVRKELTQCQQCFKSRVSGKAKLSKCGGCKVAQYCSRECQKLNWPKHKSECKLNQLMDELDPEYTDKISHLRAFCAKHRPAIAEFGIQAMNLASNPKRGLTHFVLIDVERVPGEKRIELAYKALDAHVLPYAALEEDGDMYREGVTEFHTQEEATPGQLGGIFILVMDAKSEVINVCPVSFGDDIYLIKPGHPWKKDLLYMLNKGITI